MGSVGKTAFADVFTENGRGRHFVGRHGQEIIQEPGEAACDGIFWFGGFDLA